MSLGQIQLLTQQYATVTNQMEKLNDEVNIFIPLQQLLTNYPKTETNVECTIRRREEQIDYATGF